ncbi:MAG TPA: thiamine pyrophosphate-dependent enzyme [Stellaceae bacterium]|nr:thiamine pyrophosphate-dependent enzyme [Stellaceae bacterium]
MSAPENHDLVLTGGEALVRGLEAHGVTAVFGLPGAQIYGLFDALHRAQPGIRTYGARHEQGCGYMAFGYARSTGRPAVFSVVPGPGMLNASAALLTALGGNERVLLLTGQTPRRFLDKGRGHLHEMPNQLATMRGFVKWAERIEHPGLAPGLVARAFQEMASGRPGPAALEMPWDVFTQRVPVPDVAPLAPLPPPPPDPDEAGRIAGLIAEARAPMIFVGSGAIHAAAEIRALAELIEAPVVGFRSGRGIVSEDHPLGMTIAPAYALWGECDLAIGIGSRMEGPGWRWPYQPKGLKTVRIDIDPVEMRRVPAGAAMVADAAAGTRAVLDALRRRNAKGSGRGDAIAAAKAKTARDIQAIQPQMEYLEVLRDVLPRDAIVTDELSQVGFASWFGFPVYAPRTFISSGCQGTLGSGFPTALGVKVAHPDKPVVAITGDGGFMFCVEELSTAVQYGIGVVTLVFNNRSYGNVRRDQMQGFGGRVIAADLVNPDFVKLADAFGVAGARVASPAALKPVLERALADGKPWLIEVEIPVGSETSPWRFIHPPKPEGM